LLPLLRVYSTVAVVCSDRDQCHWQCPMKVTQKVNSHWQCLMKVTQKVNSLTLC